jgi:hypothetical protein
MAGSIETHLAAFRHHNVTGLTPSDYVHTSIVMPPGNVLPSASDTHP